MDFQHLADQYRSELMDSVLPFWLEHSQDKTYGGYFSCLDRDGSVYDTDKFIWLQGREVWLFSMLCNKVEKRKEWLDCAIQGGEFLRKYGHDGKYDWYFSLTREGKPIIDPYNIFSYTFATMAFAQLAMASGNDEYAQIAKKTFDRILEKRSNPKGKWTKAHPGTRPMKDFALPMILLQPRPRNRTAHRPQTHRGDDRRMPPRGNGRILPEGPRPHRREPFRLGQLAGGLLRGPLDKSGTLARGDVVHNGPRKKTRTPRTDPARRRNSAPDHRIRMGQTVRRDILLHGPPRTSPAAARVGPEASGGCTSNPR